VAAVAAACLHLHLHWLQPLLELLRLHLPHCPPPPRRLAVAVQPS
jgi:hypothetical protein